MVTAVAEVKLPTMATTAWFHNKVADRPATLEQFAEEARQFAAGPYLTALMKGSRLQGDERAQIRRQTAQTDRTA